MNRKKRVLCVNEAPFINSGFGVFGKELLSRLYKTDKYNLAELSCYCRIDDPKALTIPWRIYPNCPPIESPERKEYLSKNVNKFGSWRFDRVLLDFKPDIVMIFRDVWMDNFVLDSPLRPYYNVCWEPTIDSSPSKAEWLNRYLEADSLMTYTDWSGDVIKNEACNPSNFKGTIYPGANLEIFKPVGNKGQHKLAMGLTEECKIIGSIMRNQKRKLYPDLFKAFRLFLDKCHENNNKALAKNTYLYLHSSYPDIGWDIPSLLKDYAIGHKVLFTYMCNNCQNIFISFFHGVRIPCPKCSGLSATLPNVSAGISPEQLRNIICLWDVYVQYSICEGFGFPLMEAAACGIPVMGVDYSGPEDVIRKLRGYPIEVKAMFREFETHADRSLPDNMDLVNKLYKFLNLPEAVRRKKGFDSHVLTQKYFDWDKTAKQWEKILDDTKFTGLQTKWDSPPRVFQPALNIPDKLDNEAFLKFCFKNILGEPDKIGKFLYLSLLNDLNYGITISASTSQWENFNQKQVIKYLSDTVNARNQMEAARCGLIQMGTPDYIQFANRER